MASASFALSPSFYPQTNRLAHTDERCSTVNTRALKCPEYSNFHVPVLRTVGVDRVASTRRLHGRTEPHDLTPAAVGLVHVCLRSCVEPYCKALMASLKPRIGICRPHARPPRMNQEHRARKAMSDCHCQTQIQTQTQLALAGGQAARAPAPPVAESQSQAGNGQWEARKQSVLRAQARRTCALLG